MTDYAKRLDELDRRHDEMEWTTNEQFFLSYDALSIARALLEENARLRECVGLAFNAHVPGRLTAADWEKLQEVAYENDQG